MSLQNWLANGWLKEHHTDAAELRALLDIVERDLKDALSPGLTTDWRFGIAYNAALKLCTMVLYANWYRPENALAHYRSIMALQEIPKTDWADKAAYLNSCRVKRNNLEYVQRDVISDAEAERLLSLYAKVSF